LRYEVVVQPGAEAELEAAYLYLHDDMSPDAAAEWFDSVVKVMLTLEQMPNRCPHAPEDTYFNEEIRHLLLRPYRLIFTIRGGQVHVLHVRHMSQQLLMDIDG